MKGLRILLVDDEPLMRLSMVDALEAVGHEVDAAASGTALSLRYNPPLSWASRCRTGAARLCPTRRRHRFDRY